MFNVKVTFLHMKSIIIRYNMNYKSNRELQ